MCEATFWHLFAFFGFAICPSRPFICTFEMRFFAFWSFCSWPRPVWGMHLLSIAATIPVRFDVRHPGSQPGQSQGSRGHCHKTMSGGRSCRVNLAAIKPRNKKHNLSFVFRSFPGKTWPRDPLQRVRLEQWCRTRLKLAPETNSKATSWLFPGLGKKIQLKFQMME